MEQVSLISANITNVSGPSPPSFSGSTGEVVPAVLLSLCVLIGVPGNLAVIIFKPNWQKLSRMTQSLLKNLALSDLLCLGMQPFWIYNMLFNWTLGTATCKIVGFLTYCSVYSSMLTVTAVGVQRYVLVIHQQRCLQFKKRFLVLLWFTSKALAVPALVFEQTGSIQQKTTCRQIYTSSAQQVAVLVTECIVGFSLLTINIFLYIFLNRKLNQAAFFNNASTSRLVNSIIVTFFLLWLPYFSYDILNVWGIVYENFWILHFCDISINLFSALMLINSCINPLLYVLALGICCKDTNLDSNTREVVSVAVS